jgi:hypothetical protein
VLESFDVVKDESRATPLRQFRDRAVEIEPADRGGHNRDDRRRLGSAFIVQRIGDSRHLRVPAPQDIEALVDGQTIQPGAQARVPSETPEFPVSIQEYLLKKVFGLLRRPDHPENQVIQASGVCAIQLLERCRVAVPAALRQLEVNRSHIF